MNAVELTEEYFVENRNRLLEIAAFLDRLDRADPARASRDFRVQALVEALQILAGDGPNYVSQLQLLLSDPTTELRPALDRKSARGAWERPAGE